MSTPNSKNRSPKHIAIMVSYAPSLINFRGSLIRELIANGVKVTAIAPDFDDEVISKLDSWGAEWNSVPLSRRGISLREDLATLKTLSKTLKSLSPDLFLSFTIKPNIWGAFAASRANIPAIACVTGLGYTFSAQGGSLKARLIRFAARSLYKRAISKVDRIIFQNPDDRDDFIAAGCLQDTQKSRIVNGSGVDMAHYKRTPVPESAVFLMISRLLGEKGVREYAEAALSLKAKNPAWRFLLVGPKDDGLDAISSTELDQWVDGGLEYLGSSSDVRVEIAQSSVYVLPSYREGTPRSVLEAMSMGRAVITSNAPGCRETVIDGKTGYLAPVKAPEVLAQHMEKLANDAALRVEMGAAGFTLAKQKYDVNVVNAQMLEHIGIVK